LSNPIIYDEANNPQKVPKEMLPIKLPKIEKLSTTGNSLDKTRGIGKILPLMEKNTLEKLIH
jgi:leucyl-tRNA synthetase